MTRIEWTHDQKTVIGLRGHDMLISAAAGSGKTAVLTERIISRIFDSVRPVHVDEMLVMTYTESAAEEMKQRISRRLADIAGSEDRQESARAREELIRLPQAQISTIHGFCSSVIRTWFSVIDLEPDFRVCADEGEQTMLQTECLERMLEEEYADARVEFLEFIEAYGGTRDDRNIIDQIRDLHKVAMSFPEPAAWLQDALRFYELEEGGPFEESRLAGLICEQTAMTVHELSERSKKLLRQCLEPGGPYVYEEAVQADTEFFSALEDSSSWEEMRELCSAHTWQSLPGKRDAGIDPDLREACKKERSAIKDQFTKQIEKPFFTFDTERITGWLRTACRQGRELVRLTLAYDAAFAALKRERKVIDFSDMEHLALQILRTRDESGSDWIAAEYRSHFAEVMVDEYQDSNYLQDEILRAVSGGKDRYNLFMVGDVKQSIYRFRNARPDLFVSKQDAFELYEEDGVESLLKRTCILLKKNFRSVPQVLDFVNALFKRLMDTSVGDITYDEKASLNPGRDIPDPDALSPCEIWVVPDDPEGNAVSPARAEAHLVAERIKAMIAHEQVIDRDSKILRPVRYGDIVILARSLSNWGDEFYEALSDEGIPVLMPRSSGYFQTLEVGTMLDFLKVIGNQKQDLPLSALMTSCIGDFSDDEMAQIRAAGREYRFFHEAVEAYLGEPADPVLGEKLSSFMGLIDSFRERAPYMPVDRLLTQMMEETGFRRYMEAMPGGVQRRANLMMLIDKARSFIRTGSGSLTGFLEYMELMDQNNVDYGEAGLFDSQADVVRMSTIHKSKGLEYPVVFLAGMGRGFNKRDLNNKVVVHPEYGLGLYAWDTATREKADTPIRQIVRRKIALDDLGEEMRVLYVACTRARERLILTGRVKDIQTYDELTGLFDPGERGLLPLHLRAQAGCYYDWILPAMVDMDKDADNASTVKLYVADQEQLAHLSALQDETDGDSFKELCVGGEALSPQAIEKQMTYQYPFQHAAGILQKVTVTELKRRDEEAFLTQLGEESYGKETAEQVEPSVKIRMPKPRFALESEEISPAERGTIHHRLLQLLDMTKTWNEKLLQEALKLYTEQGYFSEAEASVIRTNRILSVLRTDLCRRMGEAAAAGRLKREQPFVIGVAASEIDDAWPADETVLVQGMIDAYFEEDGKIIVLDYKTDRVKAADELTARYRSQMEWYARALSQLTGKEVTERYLVSLELEQVILL